MRGGWNCKGRAHRLPSRRTLGSQTKTTAIKIPYRTYATRFLILQPLDSCFTALRLLWIRTFLWRLCDTLPDIAVFFTRRLMVLGLTCLAGSCCTKRPLGGLLKPQPMPQGPARGAIEAYVPRLITSPSS